MKIYRVYFDEEIMTSGSGVVQFPPDMPSMPAAGVPVKMWETPLVTVTGRSDYDYMPGSIAAKICSSRLIEFLAKQPNPEGYLQWLPLLTEPGECVCELRVLHFAAPLPVLDESRTRYLPTGAILRPGFSRQLLKEISVFAIPGSYKIEFYINEDVKRQSDSLKLLGFYPKLVDEIPEE